MNRPHWIHLVTDDMVEDLIRIDQPLSRVARRVKKAYEAKVEIDEDMWQEMIDASYGDSSDKL